MPGCPWYVVEKSEIEMKLMAADNEDNKDDDDIAEAKTYQVFTTCQALC